MRDGIRQHFNQEQDLEVCGEAGEGLSKREPEVLALVAKGYANQEVADALGLSFETVHSYLKTIYSKLHVRSRTEAALKFRSEQS